MAATILPSALGSILQAIETRLVAASVVQDASLVKWVPPGFLPPTFDSELDVLLIVRGLTAPLDPGAGRAWRNVTRRIDVQPRVQGFLDSPDRVKVWMLGSGTADQGYFPFEEAIANALDLWWPADTAKNQLTICPLHLMSADQPVKGQQGKQSAGWGYGAVSFECKYALPLTPTFI